MTNILTIAADVATIAVFGLLAFSPLFFRPRPPGEGGSGDSWPLV